MPKRQIKADADDIPLAAKIKLLEGMLAKLPKKKEEEETDDDDASLSVASSISSDDDDDEDEYFTPKWNCNVVRRKISEFLATKEMTQTAFLAKIGVNSNSYRNFMSYTKAYQGSGGGCYYSAARFLEKREQRLKEEAKEAKKAAKQKTKREGKETGAGKKPAAKSSTKAAKDAVVTKKKVGADSPTGVSALDAILSMTKDISFGRGKKEEKIFDSCDEVRRKLSDLMLKHNASKAAMCRFIEAATDGKTKMQGAQWNRFFSGKGVSHGCEQGLYYVGYCIFERMRLALKEPKSNARVKNESKEKHGFPRVSPNRPMWVLMGP